MHHYILGPHQLENIFAERDLGVPLEQRSLMVSWAAFGNVLPAVSRGDPSPLHSTAKASSGGLCHRITETQNG